jgi:four helix bundle protein
MRDFRDLKVWEKAHELTLQIYKSTKGFPQKEIYGLTSQLRRSAVSIPANIAEGCGRGGEIELGRFLQIAMGSASEVEYHLLLARDLGYLSEEAYGQLAEDVTEVKKMLATFIKKIRSDRS